MNTPWSEGRSSSKLCVVVEAPGREEILQQRPLVGESGKLFNNCLQAAGIARSDIQIVNVCRDRIPSIDHLLVKGKLTAQGLAAREDLRVRLLDSQARVFVPMGNLAVACLTDKTLGITRLRGSPLPCVLKSNAPDVLVLPALHPAACLPFRGREHWDQIISTDLKKAWEFAHNIRSVPQRRLIINPSHSEAMDYLRECETAQKVAFDLETLNGHISCASFSFDPKHAISIPFYGAPWSLFEECVLWRQIARVLENPNSIKVGAYITSFDIPMLAFVYKILTKGEIRDITVMSRIMYPDFPASLEFMQSIFTNEPYYKDDKKLWSRPSRDPETFYRYNAKDSCVALEAEVPMWEEMVKDGYLPTWESTMAPFEAALFAGLRGLNVDQKKLAVTTELIKKRLAETEATLEETSDYPFNPASHTQCMNYFYVHKNIKPYVKRTKKPDGTWAYRPTCDDKALARLARRGYPEAKLVQDIRGYRKLINTYLEVGLDKDGRMRCVYNLKGTTTARLSSNETPWGTGMNQQNLDPRFKEFVIPG